MNYSSVVALFLLACFHLSCAEPEVIPDGNATSKPKSKFPTNYVWPAKKTNAIGELDQHVQGVEIIEFSAEVANKIGSIWHFQILDNDDLILIDRNAAAISRIDHQGNLLWQTRARDDDYRYFQSIDFFTYDPYAREVLVSSGKVIFRVGLDGQIIDQFRAPDFDWLQFARLPNDTLVYSTQTMENPGTFTPAKQLYYTHEGKLLAGYINQMDYKPKHMTFGGLPEFTRLNGHLHYHPNYRSPYYKLEEGVPKPAFTFKFDHAISMDDVMLMENLEDKLDYFWDNQIPFVSNLAVDENDVVILFRLGKPFYFGLADSATLTPKVNHRFLRYGDTVFEAPYIYQNGYAGRVVSPEERAHFEQLSPGATQVKDTWISELGFIKDRASDRSKKYLYLIKL